MPQSPKKYTIPCRTKQFNEFSLLLLLLFFPFVLLLAVPFSRLTNGWGEGVLYLKRHDVNYNYNWVNQVKNPTAQVKNLKT